MFCKFLDLLLIYFTLLGPISIFAFIIILNEIHYKNEMLVLADVMTWFIGRFIKYGINYLTYLWICLFVVAVECCSNLIVNVNLCFLTLVG